MWKNIVTKVLNMERHLNRTQSLNDERVSKHIWVVSCHGTDGKLGKTLKAHGNDLLQTNSFKNVSKPVFQFVKKTGSNIGNKLSVLKSIALGDRKGETVPCNAHRNYKFCSLVSKEEVTEVNGLPVSCAPGNCKTKKCHILIKCVLNRI